MTKLHLEDFRVHGFIDRLNAFFWVYVRSNAYGAFKRKNLLQFINLIMILAVILIYVPLMFIASLSILSEVIACGLDVCHNDEFAAQLVIGLSLLGLAFAPVLALMYIGTYYKIGDFLVVALLNESKDAIGVYGLTGRRAGANKKDPKQPGVLDTVAELAPALKEYADTKQKKIVITADAPKLKERYMPLLDLVEEKHFFGSKLVRYPQGIAPEAERVGHGTEPIASEPTQ